MDVLGAAVSVIGLVGTVAKLAQDLSDLRQRHNYAALNIAVITGSLWTIKCALEAIERLRASSRDTSQSSQQLDLDLEVSLQSCALLVAVIERTLAETNLDQPSTLDEVRIVSLDAIYQDFTSSLDTQIRGLHLLLTIFQCKTRADQNAKLENEQTRSVFREVLDSTTYLQLDDQDLQDAASTLSENPSVNLAVDAILLNTPLYQKVYKKRFPPQYIQSPAGARSISRKPLGQIKSNSAPTVNRELADRQLDPFHVENLGLPFLGIPFRGETSVPLYETSTEIGTGHLKAAHGGENVEKDTIKPVGYALESDSDEKETLVVSTLRVNNGIKAGDASPITSKVNELTTKEPDARGSSQDFAELTNSRFVEWPSIITEPFNINETDHRLTNTSDLDPPSAHGDQGMAITNNSRVKPGSIAHEPRNEKDQITLDGRDKLGTIQTGLVEPKSVAAGEQTGNFLIDNGQAQEDPVVIDCSNTERPDVEKPFDINFGPSPSLDITDLQSTTSVGGSLNSRLPDIKIIDTEAISIPYMQPDIALLRKMLSYELPHPKRPPPPIPLANFREAVSNDTGVKSHNRVTNSVYIRSRPSKTFPTVGDGSTTSSDSPFWTASSRSSSVPTTLDIETQKTVQEQIHDESLQSEVRRNNSGGQEILRPRYAKDSVSRLVSTSQHAYFPEAASGPLPKTFRRLSSMARLSMNALSKQPEKGAAVYAATAIGNTQQLSELLQENSKLVNSTTSQPSSSGGFQPRTPLMCAAIGGHVGCIEVLVSNGADAAITDKQGMTALHLAVEAGQLSAVNSLIRYAVDANAIMQRSPAANVLEASDANGSKPLHFAARTGNPDILSTLIAAGAELESRNNEGQTPLHVAVISMQDAVIAKMIEHGASIDSLDASKQTPLMLAIKTNDSGAVLYLKGAGANDKLRDINGDTIVHYAARFSHVNLIDALSTQLADLDARNNLGERPLHVACMNDRTANVNALLEKGVDVNPWTKHPISKTKIFSQKSSRGSKTLSLPCTPFHLACFHGHYDNASALIKHGAWVNATLEDTRTPLMLAVDSRKVHLVSLLLENGAKVNAATSKECLTALHFSCRNGDLETTNLLVRYGANTRALTKGHLSENPADYAAKGFDGSTTEEARAAARYIIGLNMGDIVLPLRGPPDSFGISADENSYQSTYGRPPRNRLFATAQIRPLSSSRSHSSSTSATKS